LIHNSIWVIRRHGTVPNESARLSWRRARADGAFAVNEIHVWLVTTTDHNPHLASCVDHLSSAEQARAEKFRFAKDRRQFVVSHAALRSILSQYLSLSPAEIEFVTGPNGKPRLATKSSEDLRFNLSHSGDLAVVAVASSRELGVDVELIKEEFAFDEVAECFFTAREVAALRALPSRLQRQAFYKCWTSKEAFLKAKGTGLSGELDEVEIIFDGGESARINATVPDWSLAEIDAGHGYVAALVNEGVPAALQFYQWAP
jgi:4'-phosphopantetheinyl transferase